MSALRIAIIGCGYWGPNLVRNFLKIDGVQVITVADLDPARVAAVRRAYPHLQGATNPEEVLTDPGVDAVAIATPTATHYDLARRALEHGKHVLVEKPMAEGIRQADDLLQLAQARRRVLLVDHTFVYSGAVRLIGDLLRRGDIGTLRYIDSVRVNLGLVRPDINVLWDLAPHDFAIVTHLIDAPPQTVAAIGACPIPVGGRQLESIAYVAVTYPDGILVHLHLSWMSPLKVRRMLIGGSRKMIVYDHLDPDNQVKVYDRGLDVPAAAERSTAVQRRLGDMHAPKVEQTEALEAVCRDFIDCVRTGREPVAGGRAGLAVVRLVEAAQRSLAAGGAVVTL